MEQLQHSDLISAEKNYQIDEMDMSQKLCPFPRKIAIDCRYVLVRSLQETQTFDRNSFDDKTAKYWIKQPKGTKKDEFK